MAEYFFWTGLLIVFYTYIGYGVVLYALVALKRRRPAQTSEHMPWPEVTIVVAAYNEEKIIRQKIEDTLSLDYPPGMLRLILVTDGSTDSTPLIAREFANVQLFHEQERRGKIHAVNRVMKFVATPITIFCDANTFLNRNAIKNLVRHFQDEQVGGVAGEKRIHNASADGAAGSGEGMYWRYESFLKKKDAELNSVVGAAGELFAIRTSLYEPPPEDTIIEDFYLSLRIAERGYRFAYEPDAFAMEAASATVGEEWKRKVRICAGAFQAMPRLAPLLNPFSHGLLTFQYVSHRVLRWTLAPLSIPLIFVTSVVLATDGDRWFQALLLAQLAFYAIALIGYVKRTKKVRVKGFFVPYYFVVMNAAVYAGFWKFVRRRQSVMWERAERAEIPFP